MKIVEVETTMAHLVAGLFKNSKQAGQAIAELKQAGYTTDISVIAKDAGDVEVKSHQPKQDLSDGAGAGAVLGGITGLLVGLSTIAAPGLGTLAVAGPIAALWTASGALTGGIVGALVDAGIPDEKAKAYERAIREGEVLALVTTDHSHEADVRAIMESYGVTETDTRHESFLGA